MNQLVPSTLTFSSSHQATMVQVSPDTPVAQIVTALGLSFPHALVLLNGGTAQLAPSLQLQLTAILQDGLAKLASQRQVTLMTGATDAGIFSLLGQGFAKWKRTAPCIGVCVDTLVAWQPPFDNLSETDERIPLEPHHSHFVVVTGKDWGDELTTMYTLAKYLSQHCAPLNIFAGGGSITIKEMLTAVKQGRKMILLAGSGRATDSVLAAYRGEKVTDERFETIARQGTIIPVDISQGTNALEKVVREVCHL